MYSILLLMLATVGLSIFAEDNSHRSDSDDAYSVCGQTCSACLVDVKPGEKQIDPFLKWKNIYIYVYAGCPADKK